MGRRYFVLIKSVAFCRISFSTATPVGGQSDVSPAVVLEPLPAADDWLWVSPAIAKAGETCCCLIRSHQRPRGELIFSPHSIRPSVGAATVHVPEAGACMLVYMPCHAVFRLFATILSCD